MKANNEFYSIENKIGKSLRENSAKSVPPFAGIAERIAAGEPSESFEEFFGENVQSVSSVTKGVNRIMTAAVSAAVLLLFAGGGIALGAAFSGSSKADSTAADCVKNYEYGECNGSFSENAMAEDSESFADRVSDSDLNQSDNDGDTESSS